MDFDNSIKQLGGCHLSIAKFVMELLDSSMDRLNYYEDMHMDDDDARGITWVYYLNSISF